MKVITADGPGGPEALRIHEAPVPNPAEGQVLIKVAYATLNPLDVLVRQGRVKWMAGQWPFTPGMEYGGIVERVGAGVDASLVGRKMVSYAEFGGCAEYAVAPAARLVSLVPELGWKLGIAWRTPTLMAWHLLSDAIRLQRGETILIHSAAGPVGALAAQLAKGMGARVIGLAGGAQKVSFAQQFGADTVFDYRQFNWPELVANHVNRQGVDAVIDGNGGPNAVRNYELIAPNGRVFHIGASSGMAAPQVAPPMLIAKSFSVGGFNLNAIPETTLVAGEPTLSRMLIEGRLRFPFGETVGLADVPALHARFEAREVAGRAIIKIGGEL